MARPTLFNQIGYVYFIESETQSAVKIGFTADVHARLKGIQTGNPDPLTLAAHVRATFGAEQAIHKALAKYRIRLEWYVANDTIWLLQNEIQDAMLDLAMEWIAEHPGEAVGAEPLEMAFESVVIDAAIMRRILGEVLAAA